MWRTRGVTFLLTGALATGCVSKKTYDELQADHDRLRAEMAQAQAALGERDARLAELDAALKGAQATLDQVRADLEQTSTESQAKVDQAMLLNEQLRSELESLGKNVDQLLADKGVLARSLTDASKRLKELQRAQAAAQRRAKLFKDFAAKLKKMIDAGNLRIVLRDGRMVLQLPSGVLFGSGKAEVKKEGESALSSVARVLRSQGKRKFQVAGHTDNEPIRRSAFRSNWQLSTERALAVVAFLVKQGVKAENISAAGYGEFDPIAKNTDDAGKARNRRIEITLMPNIDELVALPK